MRLFLDPFLPLSRFSRSALPQTRWILRLRRYSLPLDAGASPSTIEDRAIAREQTMSSRRYGLPVLFNLLYLLSIPFLYSTTGTNNFSSSFYYTRTFNPEFYNYFTAFCFIVLPIDPILLYFDILFSKNFAQFHKCT